MQQTLCFEFDRTEFLDRVYHFQHKLKNKRMQYIETLPFTYEWSHEKKAYFNTEVGQISLQANEVLYDIGAETDMLYIVKSGCLSVHAIVELSEQNKYPLGDYSWEICEKRRKI